MFRVQKQTALSLRFFFLHRTGKRLGRSILPDAGHLPRDLYIGLIGVDGKTVIFNLAGDSCVRMLADHRQLVTKVAVQSLKIIGQDYSRIALGIRGDVAVVDVHHVRRFDGGMR